MPETIINILNENNSSEYENNIPLWEQCIDFYNKHKQKIITLTLISSFLYTGYKIRHINNITKSNISDIKELERRIEENKGILIKIDEENSKINMWFSQKPNFSKSRKYK